MNTVFNKIAFDKLNAILVENNFDINEFTPQINQIVITFTHEMSNLGYNISKDAYIYLCNLGNNTENFCSDILELAKISVGYHVAHRAFYPNFPKQVMEASDAELFFNAVIHYWTIGSWNPDYKMESREPLFEENEKIVIGLISEEEMKKYFFKILASKDSIPESLNEFISSALNKGWFKEFNGDIPFKETLAMVIKSEIEKGNSIKELIKTTTDILRVMASLSEQDVSLKEKIKFKSLSRRTRRALVEALDTVINIDDVKSHASLWVKAFHNLHVGEYKGKSAEIANLFRNQNNVETFDTKVSEAIKKQAMLEASELLKIKPSVFARNLDKLIRSSKDKNELDNVLLNFNSVISKVDSKILLQLLGHFNRRKETVKNRLVFTAGKNGKALIASGLLALKHETITDIEKIIETALLEKFAEKSLLTGKKIFISDKMKGILLPSQLASSSESKKTIARGSHVPFCIDKDEADKDFLRFFIYWKGFDVDLSAVFLKEDYSKHSYISFHDLRNNFSTHSGDIRKAPEGASEFIDVDINKALQQGVKFVAMDVRVYSGGTFASHETCFAGYMLRNEPQSGEIYEPSTVKSKFDLTSESQTALPCFFDLEKREMIWTDIPIDAENMIGSKDYVYHNTAKENIATTQQMLDSYVNLYKQKVSLYKLVQLHAKSVNSEIVMSKEQADFIIDFDGDLSPLDFAEINANWI